MTTERSRRRALAFVQEFLGEMTRLADVMTLVQPGFQRVRLLVIWLALTLNQRLGLDRGLSFVLRWQGPRGIQTARISDVSELRVIREIFVNGEYELPDGATPKVILDLGSNVGLSVLYFRDLYPTATIIAVEPAPRAFARLRRNTEHLDRVHLVQAAAGGKDETVKLFSGQESWTSSVHASAGLPTEHAVSGRTIDTILSQAGESRADVIKMDIEGSERAILENSPAVRQADWIIFEFHQEHADVDVWEILHGLPDFEIVSMVGHSREHPLVTLRRRNE